MRQLFEFFLIESFGQNIYWLLLPLIIFFIIVFHKPFIWFYQDFIAQNPQDNNNDEK